jgi:hypothetical protein
VRGRKGGRERGREEGRRAHAPPAAAPATEEWRLALAHGERGRKGRMGGASGIERAGERKKVRGE